MGRYLEEVEKYVQMEKWWRSSGIQLALFISFKIIIDPYIFINNMIIAYIMKKSKPFFEDFSEIWHGLFCNIQVSSP